MTFDLKDLLDNVKPNLLTPHLAELTSVKNDKKPRTLAQRLVKVFHESLKDPVPKQIYHKGDIHTIRYFDIEPLMTGVWSEMSLILLNLTYAEQCDLIDALYPESVKLTAKAFAINFTKDDTKPLVVPVADDDVSKRLDATNVGIAMILSTLFSMGGRLATHPDILNQHIATMTTVAEEAQKRNQYAESMAKAEQVNNYRDHISL